MELHNLHTRDPLPTLLMNDFSLEEVIFLYKCSLYNEENNRHNGYNIA